MKKRIAFDFDGVIVESAPYFMERYRNLAKTFDKKFDVKNMEEFRDWYDSKWENNYFKMGFTTEELSNAILKTRAKVDYYDMFTGRIFHLSQMEYLEDINVTKIPVTENGALIGYVQMMGDIKK